MDILDIDEALKDDSFIFLEDKTHDDVSNILQQWRNNNCTSSHNSEQAFKLNTRTFTRPKRKSAQNLEAQFSPVPNSQNAAVQHHQQQISPNVNLEIGGLVTNMQKSFLQDTSPPSSICSSMDVSMNGMNGSLITSADFTNINFLQSTRDEPLSGLFFDTEKATEDGYTLSDMIRDRKALESLTLSGEGTLIKDSNIAQIDDISLINSKTTSACSTMNNSTDSMGGSGVGCSETFSSRSCKEEIGVDRKPLMNETFPSGKEQIPPNGEDDFIANTTFNLVDSSIVAVPQLDELKAVESPPLNTTVVTGVHNETFRKPLVDDGGVCPKRFEVVNTTFDCSESKVPCGTPENSMSKGRHYEQSTPQQNSSYTPSMRQRQQYTPSIKSADVNISPIVGPTSNRTMNETFEKSETQNNIAANILKEINGEKSWELQPPRLGGILNADYEAEVNFAFETMKLLENINSNETFNKNALGGGPSVDAADEEAFDNLLDRIGKLELNEEQIKMRKSLDTIKKRFTYGNMDKSEAKESSLISSSEMASSGISMNSSAGGDRLLSRRSRLYDDINITKTLKSSPSGSINSISFVKETEDKGGLGGHIDETQKKTDEQPCTESNEFTPVEERAPRNSKLEKRDRDRFKTIRIFKRHDDGTNELNVPCIDGELHHEPEHLPSTEEEETTPQTELAPPPPVERVSRRGMTPPVSFQSDESAPEMETGNNYATFKKPKDKVRRFGAYGGGGVACDQLNRPVILPPAAEQRSLSRPRYLSGLQKFGATNKAISAGDLEKAAQAKGEAESFNKTQPSSSSTTAELKSPMGIKSKSFHNLSSNFGYGAKAGPALSSVPMGVRKSTTAGNVLTEKQGKVNTTRTTTRINAAPASTNLKQPISRVEKSDDQVFKAPGLVSGLRAPSAKRTGLVRPSSGYYGFSVAKGEAVNTADLDAGRHSPTDSMSSASSRGSSTGKPITTNGIRQPQPTDSSLMPPPSIGTQPPATKTTTGIPKPSGLRPPSNIKRSGLPRPASIVRR